MVPFQARPKVHGQIPDQDRSSSCEDVHKAELQGLRAHDARLQAVGSIAAERTHGSVDLLHGPLLLALGAGVEHGTRLTEGCLDADLQGSDAGGNCS